MKAILGVASLLVVLAVAALVAKNQLASGGRVAARAGPAASEPMAAQLSTAVANELRERTAEAVRQGEQRLREAER